MRVYSSFPFRRPCVFGRLPYLVFSSREPTAHRWAYRILMVRRPSVVVVVRRKQFQTSSSQKPLAQSSQILCGASLGKGTKVCSRHLGHMTKMVATPIYSKNPSKIFFSRNGRSIFTKLGMKHRGLQPIILCSNDDPWVNLIYFTAGQIW